jgi:hypothetical protein
MCRYLSGTAAMTTNKRFLVLIRDSTKCTSRTHAGQIVFVAYGLEVAAYDEQVYLGLILALQVLDRRVNLLCSQCSGSLAIRMQRQQRICSFMYPARRGSILRSQSSFLLRLVSRNVSVVCLACTFNECFSCICYEIAHKH